MAVPLPYPWLEHFPEIQANFETLAAAQGPRTGAWTGVTFGTGWGNYRDQMADAAQARVEYSVESDGTVRLKGLARTTTGYAYNGAQSTVFTLPVGVRPNKNISLMVHGVDSVGAIWIARCVFTGGSVILFQGITGTNNGGAGSYVYFDGITWRNNTAE